MKNRNQFLMNRNYENDCVWYFCQTKIVHEEDSASVFSRRSSLNTEEKHLFDELQNELMSLKRVMRTKEEDTNQRVTLIL